MDKVDRCPLSQPDGRRCRGRTAVYCVTTEQWLCAKHAQQHHFLAPGRIYCTRAMHHRPQPLVVAYSLRG